MKEQPSDHKLGTNWRWTEHNSFSIVDVNFNFKSKGGQSDMASKSGLLWQKENSALSEHTCLTNHTIGWGSLKLSPLINVPLASLFGNVAYQLRQRSFKS